MLAYVWKRFRLFQVPMMGNDGKMLVNVELKHMMANDGIMLENVGIFSGLGDDRARKNTTEKQWKKPNKT